MGFREDVASDMVATSYGVVIAIMLTFSIAYTRDNPETALYIGFIGVVVATVMTFVFIVLNWYWHRETGDNSERAEREHPDNEE